MMIIKKYKYFLIAIFILVTVYFYLNISKKVVVPAGNLAPFTSMSIKQYDGTDLSKPVYIVYDGYVYDVSSRRDEFYNINMPYHYLAGRDSTTELNFAGGAIIKSKYKIIGIYIK